MVGCHVLCCKYSNKYSNPTTKISGFATVMALHCHRLGKVVPLRWQWSAKAKKKFGTREAILRGVKEELSQ